MGICQCGCGALLPEGQKYVKGHWAKHATKVLNEKKEKAPTGEIGVHGTSIWSGYITEDYNVQFRDLTTALKTYIKMLRSDATCQAVQLSMELPILALPFDIRPTFNSDEEKKRAAFIRQDLFVDMTIAFYDVLRQALSMFWAGFSLFEKVWITDKQGNIHLKKIAQRLQNTVLRWIFDKQGGCQGFIQSAPPIYKDTPIKIDKLLIFTHRKEGGNVEGVSIFRAAYRHWYYKDVAYRLQAIKAERNAVGVPAMKIPPNASAQDKAKAQEIVTHLRVDEEGGVVYPEAWDLKLLGAGGAGEGFPYSELIKHHDLMITKAALATFLNLAGTSPGSFALSRELTNLFLVAANANLRYVKEVFDRYLIKPWYRYNWGETEHYPVLYSKELDVRDMESSARGLALLVGSGLLAPDEQVVDWVRRTFYGLPALEETAQPVALEVELDVDDYSDAHLNRVGRILEEWWKDTTAIILQLPVGPGPSRIFKEVGMPRIREKMLGDLRLLEEGQISMRSFRIRFWNSTKTYSDAALAYGKAVQSGEPQFEAGKPVLTRADKAWVQGRLSDLHKLEKGVAENIRLKIAEGKPFNLESRVDSYANAIEGIFEAGRVSGAGINIADLPQVPRDGQTPCLSNCTCTLRFEKLEDSIAVYWDLGGGDSCAVCPQISANWNPFEVPKK